MFGGTTSGAIFVYIALPGTENPATDIAPEPVFTKAAPSVSAYRRPAQIRNIRAIALMAPAGGMLFSSAALEGIHIPVAIVEAGQDGLYPPPQHSHPYFVNLPVQPLRLHLSGADHFSLFARCTKETMTNLGDACGRIVGNARQELAAKRDNFLVPFFRSALGGPLPLALPSGYIADERTGEQP
jgi:predicted dienelactone hydrolase